jgi:transposase
VCRPLPAHLPRVERIVDLQRAEEKAALGKGGTLVGYNGAERLAGIPRRLRVIETERATPENG